jgi:hypothetical protein
MVDQQTQMTISMAQMFKCTSCLASFDPWAAQVAKFGKSKKILCPHCKEWIEYGRVTR